jgi:hypothetical protein
LRLEKYDNQKSGSDIQNIENADLRREPVYNTHGRACTISSSYETSSDNKTTSGLKVGTQSRLIDSARKAYDDGYPINAYLSVRWDSLLRYDTCHPLRSLETVERIRYIVELIRKWLAYRRVQFSYFWSRELTPSAGEHWHLGLHIPEKYHKAFAKYIERLLVEPAMKNARNWPQITRGEIACSEWSSWHIGVEDKKRNKKKNKKFPGFWIAAYTGKAEPSQRTFRGKLVNNELKPVRGIEFGGTQKDGRYDAEQGIISGTECREARYDIARALKS